LLLLKKNEIAQAKVVIPATHWLESWGDIAPQTGAYSLMQPTIQKYSNLDKLKNLFCLDE
jgi:anaerobic selenocysteine-containing dehydrogenase